MKQLSYGYYWDKSAPNWEEAKATGLEIVLSFMDQIRCDAGAIPIDEPQCVDFPNNTPILDWQPMNPFLDPGKIPPGYVAPPWGVVPDLPPFPFTAGDVISGLFGLPVLTPALGEGLARVRVKLTGKGTVEVHLVKVVLGGVALITWDDNPLTAQVIDLEWHVIGLPPETSDEDITEITFETEGDHHIDITMLPRFSAEAGFAGYGGGIRKVVLCGPDMQFVDRPGVEFWKDNDEVAICEAIRFNNGVLEGYCCGEWSPIPGANGAVQGGVTQPPPASPPETGACRDFYVTLNGRDKWLCPFPVSAGNKITVSSATGGWNDGGLTWACPTGAVYGLGICGSPLATDAGDPIPTISHMRLIGQVGTVDGWFDAIAGEYTVPSGFTDEQLTLQANDSTLADNQGSVTFKVTVCADEINVWSRGWNFLVESGPFVPETISGTQYAQYIPGTGWANITPGSSISMILKLIPPAGDYLHIELDVTTDVTGGNFSAGIDSEIMWPDGVPTTQTYTWDGYHTNPTIIEFNPSGTPNTAHIYFTGCRMSGVGPEPAF